MEDLQESLWSGSLATPSPTNWREEARKDKILERAVPRIQELDAERFAELKAENPDLQASYSSLDAIFLVEWNGHHELPHGLMIRGYPLAKLNAHMVFDQSSVDLVGNAVHDGIRYQRITWYGGEQGNLQVLLFSVPLQGPDSTVSVDVEASKSANEFLLDDWWSSSSPSSVYPRKL